MPISLRGSLESVKRRKPKVALSLDIINLDL
jgi:hypothetical protein